MEINVNPDRQNIDQVFGQKQYLIDFYQRDYRWSTREVERLLDDIFYPFKQTYAKSKSLNATHQTMASQYPWYYLNTYVTNAVDGHVYVVDGQQRLTTLSLILIKLYEMSRSLGSELSKWIDQKIAGHSGRDHHFWITHAAEEPIQKALYNSEWPVLNDASSITARNMVKNYETISNRLTRELTDKHIFETFVFFFLDRLVLIDLSVDRTDVPMLFESINDRGMSLRPHEILKGKLLGQIDKRELDEEGYYHLWESRANSINAHGEDQLDEFFRFYLKAKYADTRGEGRLFDGAYHREMFSNQMDQKLRLVRSPGNVKRFLKEDFSYFADLYVRLLSGYYTSQSHMEHLHYSRLLDIDAPFLLVLAACTTNDQEEDAKIRQIAYEVDRYFSLLQLQNAYDSNEFQDSVYLIARNIREQPIESIRSAFDQQLKAALAGRRSTDVTEPLSYASFRQTGVNLGARFRRYFFARIDEFLANEMRLNPKHPIDHLVTRTSARDGFHVEHILSKNDENLSLFDGDEERFDEERNRLGGVLLLKGKDNISSSNETYEQKLKTYANTLYWNETLREDSYKSKLDMDGLKTKHGLDLQPLNHFGPDEVESRHRLLFDLVKIIWA